MSGFTNPVCLIRERLVAGIGKPLGLRPKYLWGFLGIEITFIIIAFALQADRFRFFCNILVCTPLGGLAGTAEGMGECIGRGIPFHTIMKTWFFDYGHWITCSIQYFASLCYLKVLKEMGFHRVWQLLQTMVFTVFSGILLYTFSTVCINGRSGLIAHIWNAYMQEEARGKDNAYLVVFVIMWIVILLLAALGICCLLDHLNSFFRYALIMGAIWIALFGGVLIMGYRVLRGIGTQVENGIIRVIWPAFGNPVPLYWLAFIMYLLLISMTTVKALNDTESEPSEKDIDGDDESLDEE